MLLPGQGWPVEQYHSICTVVYQIAEKLNLPAIVNHSLLHLTTRPPVDPALLLSLSLFLSLSLSLSFSLSLHLSLSLSPSLSVTQIHCLSLAHSLSVMQTRAPSRSVPGPLSFPLSVSICVFLPAPSPALTPSQDLSISPYLFYAAFLSLWLHLSPSLSAWSVSRWRKCGLEGGKSTQTNREVTHIAGSGEQTGQ